MKTIRIDNGDISINYNTGAINVVDYINKAGQDVAEAILTEFNSDTQEGNELLTSGIGQVGAFNEAIASQYISEAINRLIIKQTVAGQSESIIGISQLKTQTVGLSSIVFFVEVVFSTGEKISIVDTVNIVPTKLNHLDFNPLTLLG